MIPTWAVHLHCCGGSPEQGARYVHDLVAGYMLVRFREADSCWLLNDDDAEVWIMCRCGAFLVPPAVVEWHNRRMREYLSKGG